MHESPNAKLLFKKEWTLYYILNVRIASSVKDLQHWKLNGYIIHDGL